MLPRILIVQESADLEQRLTDLLHKADYESSVASSGGEALEAVLTGRPDLVLIDHAVPAPDGIEVLRSLHAIDPDLPAIIITRNGSSEEVRAAMVNGAFDFYTRPYDEQELLTSIADGLACRRGLGAPQEVNHV
jgi:DNA-binding NtrC family response regulator